MICCFNSSKTMEISSIHDLLLQSQYSHTTTLTLLALLFLSISLPLLFKLTQKSDKRRESYLLPPSPPTLPFIGNLHQLGSHPNRSLRSLFEKYGDRSSGLMLLCLGRVPTVVVSSPETVREIAKHHDAAFSGRHTSTASDAIYHGGNSIVFSQCDDYWRRLRKLCVVELLSPKRVQSFHSVREEEVSLMIGRIRRNGVNGPVNLAEILISASNNVISRCVLGKSYGSGDGDGGIGGVVRKIMGQLMAFSVGDYFPGLKWIDRVRGFVGELRESVEELDGFYRQVVEERESGFGGGNNGDVKDFLDILLQLRRDNNDHHKLDFEITHDHLKAILQDMLFGGIETTSTVTEWFMTEVMRNPDVMKKLQQEVRTIIGQKPKIEPNDIEKMHYLKWTIKETMRLHPPSPLLVPRKTTSIVEVKGFKIPKGTRILVNAWAVQRHPDSWESPEEFVPERFENSPIDYKGQEFFQFIPFGFGRRKCPAIGLGMVGAEFFIANLLHWFDWNLPFGVKELDMSEVFGIAVHKRVPLQLVPIPYCP